MKQQTEEGPAWAGGEGIIFQGSLKLAQGAAQRLYLVKPGWVKRQTRQPGFQSRPAIGSLA